MKRPYLDSCDGRLRKAITDQSQEMLRLIWERVFQVLDSDLDRFVMSGEDAGRLAQKCVDAIADEVPECLAK